MKAKKVIIAGCRTYRNYEQLKAALNQVLTNGVEEIVSGGAKGTDQLGERYAREHQIPLKRFPANWQKYDKLAGPIRNREMASYADAAIIFWDGKSKGTRDMIRAARAAGLSIRVFGI